MLPVRVITIIGAVLLCYCVPDTAAKKKRVKTCRAGTLKHESSSSCFWFDVDSSYTWNQARRKCRSLNMMLASVHSQQENDFIRSHNEGAQLWLGLNDRQQDDYFTWNDGTRVNYQNWAPNMPDGSSRSSDQDCVAMQPDGTWTDVVCYATRGVVCRVPAQAP